MMDEEGEISHIGVLDFIKGRGNATWRSDKKSYAVKLSDAADLFGMGEAKDWILLCNGYDGSKIQNKLCLDMPRQWALSILRSLRGSICI